MTWNSQSPKIPASVQQAGTALVGALNGAKAALHASALATEAALLLALETESATTLAANAAVQAAVSVINNGLNTVLDDAGVYILVVPLPKMGLSKFTNQGGASRTEGGDFGEGNEAGSNLIRYPINAALARNTTSPLLNQISDPSEIVTGGNAHVLKTISEAVFDHKDVNRPRFDAGTTWGYILAVAGASNVTSVLPHASYFGRLASNGGKANAVDPSRGLGDLVPDNVRVAPSGRGGYAVIEWDLVPPTRTLTSQDGSTVVATQYAIIRSKVAQARTAQTVSDLFPSRDLTEGMSGMYGATVLKVRRYDGVVTRFTDEGPFEDKVTYVYHVAFATRANPARAALLDTSGEPVGNQALPVELGFNKLSSGVTFRKVSRREDFNGAPMGVAPDWSRTPSVVSIIPPLNSVVERIQAAVSGFASATDNVATRNQAYIDFLNAEIRRYETKVTALEQQISKLATFFDAPATGVYTTLRQGSGDTLSFLADVGQALEAVDGPPFTSGDEFTVAFVALAAGPDPAPVLAAYELLKLLFDPTSDDDPALAGIQSVNAELAKAEATLLDQVTAPPASNTFGQDMAPLPPGTPDFNC